MNVIQKIKYVIAEKMMFAFDRSRFACLRTFSDKCYDYAYGIYCREEDDRDPEWAEEETTPTPCGCISFNDCAECGCNHVCY